MKNEAVFADRQRRTCLVVGSSKDKVDFIRIDVDNGFSIESWPKKKFEETFTKALPDYPVERAARLYAQHSQLIGATEEAMQALGRLTTITQEEIDMATKKKAAGAAAKSSGTKPATKKAAAKKPETVKSTKKTAPAKEPKAAKPKGEKGETAAGMFRDLIREGKLTDDQIFEKVQAKFGLSDDKRGYVKWYRNSLIKAGEKVPQPK